MEQRQKPRISTDAIHPMGEIYVDGATYSIALYHVSPSDRTGLMNLLDRQMQQIHELAYLKGKKEVINEHRRLLKLPEI